MTNQLLSIKAKKFGIRLAGFRQNKGISTEVLSRWTGIPKDEIEKIEKGESSLSLPSIELIALRLGLMTSTLLSGDFEELPLPVSDDGFNKHFSALRDRMIALILRKNRIEQEKTPEAVAANCGITQEQLDSFEMGSTPIPWPVLECLCEQYQLPIDSLFSNMNSNENRTDKAPDGTEKPQPAIAMDEFVQNPANLPYLELAKKLSEIDAAKLRSIAEGLLEITY